MTLKPHFFVLLFCLIFPTVPSRAIVLHSEDDQPPVSARPSDLVMGQWSTNASCVAIGRDGWDSTNYILSTCHQGGGVGTTVKFGGTGYRIAEEFFTGRVDIRISRLETLDGYDAKLPDFVQWYTNTNETNKPVVMGGFGKGKGIEVNDRDAAYYTWANSYNDTQRWGTNNVGRPMSSLTSEVLSADFDRESSEDCALAEYDSGGGWFINDGGIWKVAALNASVEHMGRSYYKPADQMYGIRISSYAPWIDGIIVPEPATLSLLLLGGIVLINSRRKLNTQTFTYGVNSPSAAEPVQ